MQTIGADDHPRPYLVCRGRDSRDGTACAPDEPGHAVTLANDSAWLFTHRIDQDSVERGAPDPEPGRRATVCRARERNVDLDAGTLVAVGHALQRAGAGCEDTLIAGPCAGGRRPLAA